MPAFALGWYFAAAHMRLTRSSMLEVLGSEYIKLARLKGLPESLVIAKHAFKNALIPVLTLAGHQPRHHDQRGGGGGDGVRLARHRPAALRGHHLPRLPGRAGRRAAGRRHDRGGEPADRHPLRRDRSAHPTGERDGHGHAAPRPSTAASRCRLRRGWRASRAADRSSWSASRFVARLRRRAGAPRSRDRHARRALPSAGLAGRRQRRVPARHRPPRSRRAVAADLRRPGLDGGRLHRRDLRRRRRHRARHPLRLPRRLGRPGHHAHHRHLAGAAGADLRHLPGRHRRARAS